MTSNEYDYVLTEKNKELASREIIIYLKKTMRRLPWSGFIQLILKLMLSLL